MRACLVQWYADRGIPFRRGYLLHGVPGSGKSSLIHALAGALMLDIYVISLSASWMNDATLSSLMGRVPARCIVLLEDLDAAAGLGPRSQSVRLRKRMFGNGTDPSVPHLNAVLRRSKQY